MGDLVAMLFEFDIRSTNGPSKQAAALRSIGKVTRLDFFDPSTLHATDMEFHETTLPFQYLLVQLPQRIVILNLRIGPNSHALSPEQRLANPQSPYHFVVAHIIDENIKAAPTTMAVPLTSSLIVIGCSDGALRVYDFTQDKVVKSVRGPSGKDSIHQLLAANNAPTKNIQVELSDKRVKRVLAIGKTGVTFLWDMVLQNGALVDVRPPLVRIDGFFGNSSASSGEEQEGSGESSLEHTYYDYDAHRNYFLWFVPTGYQGSAKACVLMWDLNSVQALTRKRNVTPKLEPVIGSIACLEGPLTLVPGWLHPSFPANTLTCAVATLNGEVHVVCVPISDAKPGRTVKAIPFFSDNLGALIQRDAGILVAPKVRVQSITTFRRLDTAAVLIGSNVGLVMVSVTETVCSTGARHAHFGAGMADWSNSVLTVDHSTLVWAQLDIPETNPCAKVLMKNPTLVYKSPPALHLSPEMRERAVRLPPRFLPSPSGNFICLYWQDESRYEILHLASILRRNDGSYSPAVSSGSNVLSFAWVGDDDVFGLLYPATEVRTDGTSTVVDSTWSVTSASTKDTSTTPSAAKASGARALRKSFNFMNDKVRKPVLSSSPSMASSITATPKEEYSHDASRHGPRVELKVLVPVDANAAEISGSIAAATATILGDITLRGGNRSPPTTLFGGPVLCVASKSTKDADGGTAYFYTRKPGTDETRAAAYISSGPSLPCPDFLEWDDDGRLCAVVVQSRVAIYLSEAPEFVLLGNVQLGSHAAEPDATVTGIKFIHGVLYCTTKTAVQCVFLGNLEEGICHLDSFVLASAQGPGLSRKSWSPSTLPMTLNHPIVLGYQSGSLLLSTVNGLQAVPLSHPLLRIGSLLGAGQPERAKRWLERIPESDHEPLANFLGRRGAPDLAVQLPGLSLETTVDMCLRHGLTERLEEVIDLYGLDTIRKIDFGRGVEHGHSLVICVGAYLLSQGKAELVRRLATECLRSGEEGKQEAFVLASLLLAVDEADARRLVKRAVVGGVKSRDDDDSLRDEESAVLSLIRNHIL
jgi:hypothetical protein